jgi:hypothetical protein
MEDGRWKMEDGRWKMEDGRWKMETHRYAELDCQLQLFSPDGDEHEVDTRHHP